GSAAASGPRAAGFHRGRDRRNPGRSARRRLRRSPRKSVRTTTQRYLGSVNTAVDRAANPPSNNKRGDIMSNPLFEVTPSMVGLSSATEAGVSAAQGASAGTASAALV